MAPTSDADAAEDPPPFILPTVESYVLADDPPMPGFCFYVNQKRGTYGVVFSNGWWSGFKDFPWSPCPDE